MCNNTLETNRMYSKYRHSSYCFIISSYIIILR